MLYLKRAAPGYELKFNTGIWAGRDFHPPPLFPLSHLGSLFLKMPALISPGHRYWTGTAGIVLQWVGAAARGQGWVPWNLWASPDTAQCALQCGSLGNCELLKTGQKMKTLYVPLLNLVQRAFSANTFLCAQWSTAWIITMRFPSWIWHIYFDGEEWDQ